MVRSATVSAALIHGDRRVAVGRARVSGHRSGTGARRLAFACLTAAAFITTACSGGSSATPATSAPTTSTTSPVEDEGDGVLTIGVLMPTTGPGQSLGEPIRAAIEDEVRTINEAGGVLDERVRLVFANEANDQGLSTLLSTDSDPVDAIIGPASSKVALRKLGETTQPGREVVTCSPSATALGLDDFDSNGWFFRTAPSDSLQMAAIASRAQSTGNSTVAVAYLDDPYGRGLASAFETKLKAAGQLSVTASIPIPSTLEDLTKPVSDLLTDDPGVIVVLADAATGGRILTAIDDADKVDVDAILVNDTVRNATKAIEGLKPSVRAALNAIAPTATFTINEDDYPPFTAQAIDCVDLIALAAVRSGSDARSDIRQSIAILSVGGSPCAAFIECSALLLSGRQIDYTGRSGKVDLADGNVESAYFDSISFSDDGTENKVTRFTATAS